jgi:cell division septation protein DedD
MQMISSQRVIWMGMMLALAMHVPSLAYAFSFGDIRVKSTFGERFEAEFELKLDDKGEFDVSLGGKGEYEMLELNRQSIMDNLKIEVPPRGRGLTKTVRVVSDKPLFFPSFDLVVRASHGGDTIMKSYLITVDFQQNLALNLQGGKRKSNKTKPQTLKQNKDKIGADSAVSEEVVEANKQVDGASRVIPAPSSFSIAPSSVADRQRVAMPSSGSIWVAPRGINQLQSPASHVEELDQIADALVKSSPEAEPVSEKPLPLEEDKQKSEDSMTADSSSGELAAKPSEPSIETLAEVPAEKSVQAVKPQVLVENGEQHYSDRRFKKLEKGESGDYEIRTPVQLAKVEEMLPVDEVPRSSSPTDSGGADSGISPSQESGKGFLLGNSRKIQKGQNLLQIARELPVPSFDTTRVAVALWLENQDKFILGNMNGVRVGTRFNLDNLRERLETLDANTARAILRNHWREWKILRNKNRVPEEEEASIEEVSPPSQQTFDKMEIFDLLRNWKRSWEEGDLPGHMENFSLESNLNGGRGGQNLRSMKKRMFQRYREVQLDIHRSSLFLKGGRFWVSFYQGFSSEKIDSFGRKEIEIIRDDKSWKIANERFKLKRYREKENLSLQDASESEEMVTEKVMDSPFVIHVSSHISARESGEVIGELRNEGYNAYLSFVKISPTRNIYRVYVGRFTDWDLARELALDLRSLKIGEHAIPTQHPYAVEVGDYSSEEDAAEKMDSLRAQGLSPFLFTTSEDGFFSPRFRVYLGAFIKAAEAVTLAEALQEMEIPHSIVTP